MRAGSDALATCLLQAPSPLALTTGRVTVLGACAAAKRKVRLPHGGAASFGLAWHGMAGSINTHTDIYCA